jgi:hypothetical protein
MESFFSHLARAERIGSAPLQTVFDAERATPHVIDRIEKDVPQIRRVMASLRDAVPLVPHSGVGPIGRSGFFRVPNHYRSVSFILPPAESGGASPGVVVFKGTEPLIEDFPAYFDWMLSVPFRGSALPLGLHFPLDMKLPPAAMWIEECVAEQSVASQLQQQYLERHGRLARLPLPLFVFRMMPEQTERYEHVIRRRLPEDALRKIKNKLGDGLGVEVYYYPELPVRVADLFIGKVRETFNTMLAPEQVEETFDGWAILFSEMLCLDYMPYAPWHHGMGGCCDAGNVCIDGGFHDLLTLVPFDAIPDDVTFRQSVLASIRMLSDSMVAMAAASVGVPSATESDAVSLAAAYITERLRGQVLAAEREGHAVDIRLKRFCATPAVGDILNLVREASRGRAAGPAQFVGPQGVVAEAVERRILEETTAA